MLYFFSSIRKKKIIIRMRYKPSVDSPSEKDSQRLKLLRRLLRFLSEDDFALSGESFEVPLAADPDPTPVLSNVSILLEGDSFFLAESIE